MKLLAHIVLIRKPQKTVDAYPRFIECDVEEGSAWSKLLAITTQPVITFQMFSYEEPEKKIELKVSSLMGEGEPNPEGAKELLEEIFKELLGVYGEQQQEEAKEEQAAPTEQPNEIELQWNPGTLIPGSWIGSDGKQSHFRIDNHDGREYGFRPTPLTNLAGDAIKGLFIQGGLQEVKDGCQRHLNDFLKYRCDMANQVETKEGTTTAETMDQLKPEEPIVDSLARARLPPGVNISFDYNPDAKDEIYSPDDLQWRQTGNYHVGCAQARADGRSTVLFYIGKISPFDFTVNIAHSRYISHGYAQSTSGFSSIEAAKEYCCELMAEAEVAIPDDYIITDESAGSTVDLSTTTESRIGRLFSHLYELRGQVQSLRRDVDSLYTDSNAHDESFEILVERITAIEEHNSKAQHESNAFYTEIDQKIDTALEECRQYGTDTNTQMHDKLRIWDGWYDEFDERINKMQAQITEHNDWFTRVITQKELDESNERAKAELLSGLQYAQARMQEFADSKPEAQAGAVLPLLEHDQRGHYHRLVRPIKWEDMGSYGGGGLWDGFINRPNGNKLRAFAIAQLLGDDGKPEQRFIIDSIHPFFQYDNKIAGAEFGCLGDAQAHCQGILQDVWMAMSEVRIYEKGHIPKDIVDRIREDIKNAEVVPAPTGDVEIVGKVESEPFKLIPRIKWIEDGTGNWIGGYIAGSDNGNLVYVARYEGEVWGLYDRFDKKIDFYIPAKSLEFAKAVALDHWQNNDDYRRTAMRAATISADEVETGDAEPSSAHSTNPVSASDADEPWNPRPVRGDILYYNGIWGGRAGTYCIHQGEDHNFDRMFDDFHFFPTEAEALETANRERAMRKLRKIAKYLNWYATELGEYYIAWNISGKFSFVKRLMYNRTAGTVHFISEEAALEAIRLMGDDIKYLFEGVE